MEFINKRSLYGNDYNALIMSQMNWRTFSIDLSSMRKRFILTGKTTLAAHIGPVSYTHLRAHET